MIDHVSASRWDGFWQGDVGQWLRTDGVHIVVLVVVAVVGARLISLLARRFAARIEHGDEDAGSLVLSESTKHRRALASVMSSVAISVLYVVIAVDLLGTLGISVSTLVAPAAVLGATEARGTVEDVTLRVTRLRNIDGEVFNVPNGQIVKTQNLSKDWARAVVDIPLPVGTDLVHVSGVLKDVARAAMRHDGLPHLLLDEPSVMGIESIQRDTVCMRMVARTLPGKQFEAGRNLRALVAAALRRHDVVTDQEATTAAV